METCLENENKIQNIVSIDHEIMPEGHTLKINKTNNQLILN
jgi:hypothetical protein